MPDRAQFEADHSRTDNQQFLRHFLERQRACRRHDALLIDLDALEPGDIGAGGDDNVFGFERLSLAIGAGHFDFTRAGYLALARDDIDLVFLHQELDALHIAVDALLLEVHHRA